MFGFATRQSNQPKKRRTPNGRRQRGPLAALRTRLRFEPLEERRLLTVITVNDLGDSDIPQVVGNGKITLRDAILAANTDAAVGNAPAGHNADTIQFTTGLTGTITLTAGELLITDDLTISGPGAAKLTISGNGAYRIFNINDNDDTSNFDATIDGLTLTSGHSTGSGGAIFSAENLTLTNSILTVNSAAKGGALWAQPSDHGDTTIQNCTISNNTATGDAGGIGFFAYLGTDVSIQNSTISGNAAGGGGGGIDFQITDVSSMATIQNSTISGNTAVGDGGGIRAQTSERGELTIQSSTISGNLAGQDGGGIFADTSYSATTTIKDNAISGNTAGQNGAGIFSYTEENATTNFHNDAISGNTATGDGGGIWTECTSSSAVTIQYSNISGGNSAASGGGIYLNSYGGTTTVQYTTVSGNTATAYGGGIAALAETDTAPDTPVDGATIIQNSTVSGNTADQDGGGIWIYTSEYSATTLRGSTVSGNVSNQHGGGLYVSNYYGTTNIQNSTITGNTADDGGGGVYLYFYSEYYSSAGSPTISSAIIAGNSDTSDTAPDLYLDSSLTLSIDHSLVGDNTGSGLTAAPVGSPDANGNLIGDPTGAGVIDPKLGSLANNGGFTKTHAIAADSPAKDKGTANSQTYDQRGYGYLRTSGAMTDMGAYEIVTPNATPPEITVLDGGTSIPSGQTTPISIGAATKGAAGPTKTFTIRNDGQQTLILTMPFASTSHFAVGQPSSTLTAGATTTFTVTLKTGSEWSGSEQISIGSNDGDGDGVVENPFTFIVSGTVHLLHDSSTPGVYAPSISRYYIRYTNTNGTADKAFVYGPGGAGWSPLVGDWDGNGTDTAGLYNPTLSRFYLRNANTNGMADVTFIYGPGGAGWIPIVGDWNGDGIDTTGLYNPTLSRFYLRNTNTNGMANVTFIYGPGGAGWKPLTGDWDGDGIDTTGLYNPTLSRFYLRNANTNGMADVTFIYGPGGAGWKPLAGDWDGNGTTTIGLHDPTISRFYLRNSNTNGTANTTFVYGPGGAGWTPLVGDWDGYTSGLQVAGGAVVAAADAASLTLAELQPLLREAIARWTAAGLSASAASVLNSVNVEIVDLAGSHLGKAGGNTIYIDQDAAGHGWFVDPTPEQDEEFAASGIAQQQIPVDPLAVDRIDLLTVVEHELGHILGLDDLDALVPDLMSGWLNVGIRRMPSL